MIKKVLFAALFSLAAAHAASLSPLQSIPLPGVEGRIDHMAVDLKGKRLFVAALGHGAVEIVDLEKGAVSKTISGLAQPQGVLFHPATKRLFVAGAGDGSLSVFESPSFKLIRKLSFPSDADNLRYDSASDTVFLGYGDGAIAAIDPAKLSAIWEAKLAAHPESFQLQPNGSRIFVNVPDSRQIVVIDRTAEKSATVWPQEWSANFPMSIDPAGGRIFVAFRQPAKLAVVDVDSGRHSEDATLCGDCDDLFFDSKRNRIYAACGEGKMDVFTVSKSKIALESSLKTAPGARTALFVPELSRIYLAVPHRGAQRAEIRVFDALP